MACTALSVATAVLVAPSLGVVVDCISRGTAATTQELATAVGRLGAVYIVSNVALSAQVALSLSLGEALAHRLRCRLFGALLSRDALFFDSVRTGQMVAWLGQDVEVLQVRLRGWCRFCRAAVRDPATEAQHCRVIGISHVRLP